MTGYTFCDTCGARDDTIERGLAPNAVLQASQGGYARGWSEAVEYLKTEPFMLGDQLANAIAEVERQKKVNTQLCEEIEVLQQCEERYREREKALKAAAGPFTSGGGNWGAIKAWIVHRAPERTDGIKEAAWITRSQAALDKALAASAPATAPKADRHTFKRHSRHLFCGVCGYPENEALLHIPAAPNGETI